MSTTLVVIVNYRTAGLTIDCLRSLALQVAKRPGTRVVVADNASQDDSVERLRAAIDAEGFAPWCWLVPLPRNGGFAYGNNEAIAWVKSRSGDADTQGADLVWLLNPDTVVLEDALLELERFMLEHPEAGIAGGRAVNADGSVRASAFRFHSPLGELESVLQLRVTSRLLRRYAVAPEIPNVSTRVDWVSGASMMVRRSVFDRIGPLDDAYFMYYEETDFCLRAARAGIERWYVPQSRIIHLVGQSSGVTGAARASRRRPRYWFESRCRYFRRNHGTLTLHVANLLWLVAYPVGSILLRMRGKRREDPPLLWWDFLRFNYFHSIR
jgi:N-acetylglucosaminyl-diphospho-decaprenol L-rhamnosyltransferase